MSIINRYGRVDILKKESGDALYATPEYIRAIREGVADGTIIVNEVTVATNDRLDQVAGRFYGDGSLWWVIAAASDIGWGLQIQGGTRVFVPVDLSSISDIVG